MTISCLVVTGHSDLPETYLLIGLFRAGFDLTVMTPQDAPNQQLLRDAGIPVIDLKLTSRFDFSGIKRIKHFLQENSVDILHLFNNKAVCNGLIASKGFTCSVIVYRGIEGNVSYYDPLSWLTYLHPRVSVIVCVAEAIRQYFLNMRLFGIRKPVKNTITIHKGHDTAWYPQESYDLQNLSISPEDFVVCCTVNDRPRKGLRYLIAATHHLPKKMPIQILLIGRIKKKELKLLAQKSPLAGRIHFLGFKKDVFQIVKACDVCILPATKREGLPKGIIEGMIQGVAPIVTDTGGSPELIVDKESGLIIPPKSPKAIAGAIKSLYENAELLKNMKNAAKARIENDFPIQTTIDRHIELYQRIYRENPSTSE